MPRLENTISSSILFGRDSSVRITQAEFLAAQSRQKKYEVYKVRDMEFQTSENIICKVSPMKKVMSFGKKSKLSPCCICPFEVLECVRPVGHRLGDLIYREFIMYFMCRC